MRVQIGVTNVSSLGVDEVARIVKAVQHQVTHDFRPVWGLTAELSFHGSETPPEDRWWVVVANDSDEAGALGYHDLTSALYPMARVFTSEGEPSVTFSHEVLEMLADPWINASALDPASGRLYAYEVCDACEADELGYEVNGVTVSDFVLPQYFDPNHAGRDEPLSFCDSLREPFSLAPGGYASFLDLGDLGAGWQQTFAKGGKAGERARLRPRASFANLKPSKRRA